MKQMRLEVCLPNRHCIPMKQSERSQPIPTSGWCHETVSSTWEKGTGEGAWMYSIRVRGQPTNGAHPAWWLDERL